MRVVEDVPHRHLAFYLAPGSRWLNDPRDLGEVRFRRDAWELSPEVSDRRVLSFAFADDPGDSVLLVPEVVVGRRGDVCWVTTIGVDAIPAATDVRPTTAPLPPTGVAFADGARVHIDADTGAVLALRTRQWRLFDLMWGLHIMDLRGRENTSHPVLIASAALALVATVLGLVLLPVATRRR